MILLFQAIKWETYVSLSLSSSSSLSSSFFVYILKQVAYKLAVNIRYASWPTKVYVHIAM
jgi:hypothetical protein